MPADKAAPSQESEQGSARHYSGVLVVTRGDALACCADAVDALEGAEVHMRHPETARRDSMQEVCSQCHGKTFVEGAYDQFDGVVELYNEKFAKPAKAIMAELKERGFITKANFDDPIEWTWWEIWHHEGRRARHGASMQGPDYTWWHGMYEVAKHFYEKFIPQLEEVAGKEVAKELLDKYVYTQEGHLWHRDGMSKDALQKIQKFYEDRYQQ